MKKHYSLNGENFAGCNFHNHLAVTEPDPERCRRFRIRVRNPDAFCPFLNEGNERFPWCNSPPRPPPTSTNEDGGSARGKRAGRPVPRSYFTIEDPSKGRQMLPEHLITRNSARRVGDDYMFDLYFQEARSINATIELLYAGTAAKEVKCIGWDGRLAGGVALKYTKDLRISLANVGLLQCYNFGDASESVPLSLDEEQPLLPLLHKIVYVPLTLYEEQPLIPPLHRRFYEPYIPPLGHTKYYDLCGHLMVPTKNHRSIYSDHASTRASTNNLHQGIDCDLWEQRRRPPPPNTVVPIIGARNLLQASANLDDSQPPSKPDSLNSEEKALFTSQIKQLQSDNATLEATLEARFTDQITELQTQLAYVTEQLGSQCRHRNAATTKSKQYLSPSLTLDVSYLNKKGKKRRKLSQEPIPVVRDRAEEEGADDEVALPNSYEERSFDGVDQKDGVRPSTRAVRSSLDRIPRSIVAHITPPRSPTAITATKPLAQNRTFPDAVWASLLDDREWLSCEVLDLYSNFLQESYPTAMKHLCIVPTFATQYLNDPTKTTEERIFILDHEGRKRFLRSRILLPVHSHSGTHWSILLLEQVKKMNNNKKKKKKKEKKQQNGSHLKFNVYILDSLNESVDPLTNLIKALKTFLPPVLEVTSVSINDTIYPQHLKKQTNAYDCGIYCMQYMEVACTNASQPIETLVAAFEAIEATPKTQVRKDLHKLLQTYSSIRNSKPLNESMK
jgi:hypothetical protein